MTPADGTERELKLGVWPEFELPDLSKATKGGAAGNPVERRLEAVYFDTPDLRLLRRGITLRLRRDEDAGAQWTVKLPAEGPTPGLGRREISLPAASRSMPGLLRELTRGWALGAALEPVARMVTTRRSIPLVDAGGGVLATIDDDEVAVIRDRQVAARFREVEVELAEGAAPKLLVAVAKRLRAAGAQPVPQVPKLAHALGPEAAEPWDLAVPEPSSRPSAGEVMGRHLTEAAGRGLVDRHAAIVLGDDAGAVRAAGEAVRRIVADVRAFFPLLDADAVGPLTAELEWLADELGRFTTLDALIDRLPEHLADVELGGAVDAVLTQLTVERAARRERVLALLRGARYRKLLTSLAAVVADPPIRSRRAGRPADTVLPSLVREALKDLRRDVTSPAEAPDDAALLVLGWPVERLRSAIDAATPMSGPPARRAARGLDRLRALLDDHRDALQAARELRIGATRDEAWVAGVLAGIELQRAAACRTRFVDTWRQVGRKGRWVWLD